VPSEGKELVAQGSVELTFLVNNENVKKMKLRVINDRSDAQTDTFDIEPNERKHYKEIALFKGVNTLTLYAVRDGEAEIATAVSLKVTCNGRKCGRAAEPPEEDDPTESTSGGSGGTKNPPRTPGGGTDTATGGKKKPPEKQARIKILSPTPGKENVLYDADVVRLMVEVNNNNAPAGATGAAEGDKAAKPKPTKKLYIKVDEEGGRHITDREVDVKVGDYQEVVLPLAKSTDDVEEQEKAKGEFAKLGTVNVITVSDAENPAEKAATKVKCIGNCGGDTENYHSSIYTRAILGFEQAGVSAGNFDQKPFVDLFFGAPLGKKGTDDVPALFSVWGNVRVTSIPQQQASPLNTFSTGFLDFAQGLEVNKLAQGFEFLGGVDIRLIPTSSKGFLSLIPGIREKTSLSFVLSGGATNPFTTERTAQIFKIPKKEDGTTTTDAFLKLFPEAEGKTNIAFVTPLRDRFLRQWYAGLRMKTFFYDRRGELINRFPAILDLQVGQNEAVTGKLRHAVLRIEGFYPFPLKGVSYLYLFGTTMLKVGGGGNRSVLPLNLDRPDGEPSLTDETTLIVPIDRHPNLRSTRDFYRLGIGINLIELFNKIRPATPADQ
jgi:hypothetical protein